MDDNTHKKAMKELLGSLADKDADFEIWNKKFKSKNDHELPTFAMGDMVTLNWDTDSCSLLNVPKRNVAMVVEEIGDKSVICIWHDGEKICRNSFDKNELLLFEMPPYVTGYKDIPKFKRTTAADYYKIPMGSFSGNWSKMSTNSFSDVSCNPCYDSSPSCFSATTLTYGDIYTAT